MRGFNVKTLTTLVGRILFGLPFAIFGLFHFLGAQNMVGMVPTWLPGGVIWIYLTGVALLLGGIGIISGIKAELAALVIAALMGIFILTVHLPGMGNEQMRQMAMAGLLKDMALMGAALTFAGLARGGKRR